MPDDIHERLRRQAQASNSTMSAIVLTALERELKRLEWRQYWEQIPPLGYDINAAEAIAQARAERDAELEEARLEHETVLVEQRGTR